MSAGREGEDREGEEEGTVQQVCQQHQAEHQEEGGSSPRPPGEDGHRGLPQEWGDNQIFCLNFKLNIFPTCVF